MGRQHGRYVERALDQGQRVGVDDDRHAVGLRLGEHGRHVGAAARSRPSTPGRGPSRSTTSGCAAQHLRRRPRRRTGPSRTARSPRPRRRGRRRRGTAPSRPGRRRRRGCTCGRRASGRGSSARDVVGLQALDRGLREVEADVDEVHDAGVLGGRVRQQRDLVGAEGDGDVGADGGPVELAGVHVDAARYVDRHDRDAVSAWTAAGASGRSPGRPPIPTIPSTTRSGASRALR